MSHGPTYAPNGVLKIRKSMLEDFGFCPHRFKKVWQDGVERKPNQAMLMGTRFHDFAQTFFEYALVVDPLKWDGFIPKEFIPEEVAMASWFINNERERYFALKAEGRILEFLPILREFKLNSEKLYLEGTVDRVDWLSKEKGLAIAVEYKTGKSINHESITKQLAMYALMYHDMRLDGEIVGLRLINPRLGVVKDYKLERWHTDKVLKDIVKLRDALRNKDFPAKCSDVKYAFCRMCTPEESGIKDGFDDAPMNNDVDPNRLNFRFTDVYKDD
jgi:CRISPR/Cas system-associated exonuclease Cas4 (RecB family)